MSIDSDLSQIHPQVDITRGAVRGGVEGGDTVRGGIGGPIPAILIGDLAFWRSFPKATYIYCTRNDQNCPDGILILTSRPCPSKFLVAPPHVPLKWKELDVLFNLDITF